MIVFPNIKINLGLSITEKRPDGYHNLETVFYLSKSALSPKQVSPKQIRKSLSTNMEWR